VRIFRIGSRALCVYLGLVSEHVCECVYQHMLGDLNLKLGVKVNSMHVRCVVQLTCMQKCCMPSMHSKKYKPCNSGDVKHTSDWAPCVQVAQTWLFATMIFQSWLRSTLEASSVWLLLGLLCKSSCCHLRDTQPRINLLT
jgi:hypothetical protein